MVVYGNPTELKDFRDKVLHAQEKGDELKHWHLYQIYEEFGYEEKFILNGEDNNGYIRGNIDYVDEIVEDKRGFSYLRIDYESAWSSMYEGFDWLLKRHYKTLKQVTIAEEFGCEVFINTDKDGLFFEERFILEAEDIDTFYAESKEQLIKVMNEEICKGDVCHSLQDCYDYIDSHDELYISLHEYSCD